jgi:undecaprenyl diphosphate synthase
MLARGSRSQTSRKTESEKKARDSVPRHVAVIMDGNGRWAAERGLSRQEGHRAGTENLRRIIRAFGERNVPYLTLFAFSTENWSRPRREVNALLRLVGRVIDRELRSLHENNVRLKHLGSLEPLSPDLQRRVQDAVEMTKDNTGITVCVAFNYGGRAEIVEAVRRIVADGVPADAIDESSFASYLATKDIPDPDLIVRTAGEHRLSNFLIWQSIYSEFYFTPCYWPDFDEEEVDRALDAYAQRVRRFGGLNGSKVNGARSNGSKASNGSQPGH